MSGKKSAWRGSNWNCPASASTCEKSGFTVLLSVSVSVPPAHVHAEVGPRTAVVPLIRRRCAVHGRGGHRIQGRAPTRGHAQAAEPAAGGSHAFHHGALHLHAEKGFTAKTNACRPSPTVLRKNCTWSSASMRSRSASVACTPPVAACARTPKCSAEGEYHTSTSDARSAAPATGGPRPRTPPLPPCPPGPRPRPAPSTRVR